MPLRFSLSAEPPYLYCIAMAVPTTVRRFRRSWRHRRSRNFNRSAWQEIGGGVFGQFYVDRGGGPGDTILLAGRDRSGTTWIAQALNHDRSLRYIYEPFHPDRTRFTPRLYLRPGDSEPRYIDAARAVLSGRTRSLWADRYNRAVLPTRRLVKEIRRNLLLPWLSDAFPDMRIVFLLRHPCAVADSERRLSSRMVFDLSRFLSQDELMEDYLEPFRPRMLGVTSDWEKSILLWCIENYVPFSALSSRAHIAFYEDFCVDPEGELRRLFEYAQLPFSQAALEELSKPSATIRTDSAITTGRNPVAAWRRNVTDDEVRSAMEIVELFGLEKIYGAEPMPLYRSGQP
jgi:hypothetical protein